MMIQYKKYTLWTFLTITIIATVACVGNSSSQILANNSLSIKKSVNQMASTTIVCHDKPIGSKFVSNGVEYLVVGDLSSDAPIHKYVQSSQALCTSHVSNMFNLFNDVDIIMDISNWDTSMVTDMSFMFYKAVSFNQEISKWDTHNVTNMSQMFYGATSFNQDISKWDTRNVTNMLWMFASARSFNQDIGGWNTSNVTDMSRMFSYARLFNKILANGILIM